MSSPQRLLIVDDDESVRSSLYRYFDEFGFDVTAVESASEALTVLEERAFDAGIIDMRLPDMNGDALILAAHRARPEMRFLIYTGSSNFWVSEDLERIGVTQDLVVQKPVDNLSILKDKLCHLQVDHEHAWGNEEKNPRHRR